jgi:hypothetical protein
MIWFWDSGSGKYVEATMSAAKRARPGQATTTGQSWHIQFRDDAIGGRYMPAVTLAFVCPDAAERVLEALRAEFPEFVYRLEVRADDWSWGPMSPLVN